MIFSSLVFLNVFLPILLFIYFLTPVHRRNMVLLIASLIFYAWGEPRLLSVMLVSVLFNYMTAQFLAPERKAPVRKLFVTLGIIGNLAVLGYFKYADFFIANINALTGFTIPQLHLILPIGISFYTFQAISYLVDVYRNDVPPEKNLPRLGLFITFFPQLIAGPIIKYHDISAQIASRRESFPLFSDGLVRFCEGLAKKVLIANVLGEYADTVFALESGALTPQTAWLGAAAYMLQIFFDFSGYSDMAIGLGKMFGFTIPENFNLPYISLNITEFWRRWHISLSTWFKEYLYIPLGGNRVGKFRNLFNLAVVFLATGFWHGASWTFLLWGAWHGFFILLERVTGLSKKSVPWYLRPFFRCYLLLTVLVGWVFFRADDLGYSVKYIKTMFNFPAFSLDGLPEIAGLTWFMFGAGILFSTALPRLIRDRLSKFCWFSPVWKLLTAALYMLVFLRLAASSYNPFIYFRF